MLMFHAETHLGLHVMWCQIFMKIDMWQQMLVKLPQYKISLKSVQHFPSYYMWTHIQTDLAKIIGTFLQLQ